MFERLPERRHVRRLSLLALAVLLITALPGLYPAASAAPSFKPLEDSQADFSKGSFQRTAISSGISSTFNDVDGALQLAAVGQLNAWPVTTPDLPLALGNLGVTTIGNRLYTVGGAGLLEPFTNAVFWATADQQLGSFKNHGFTEATKPPGSSLVGDVWVNEPLPAAKAYMSTAPYAECNAEPIQARRAPAVATYVANSGTAFIYAIGGAFLPNPTSLCSPNVVTSPVVQRGTVNLATGDITWTRDNDLIGSYLPSQDRVNTPGEEWANPAYFTGLGVDSLGVEGAAAAIMHHSDGKVYLYVIGGLVTYPTGGTPGSLVTPAVFYTRLSATGAFENPKGLTGTGTPWVRTANVPLNVTYNTPPIPVPGELGIYNHTAMVSRSTVGTAGGGTTAKEAIYVTGGFTTSPLSDADANSFVFRAMFDDAKGNGEIKWDTVLNPAKPGQNVSTDGQGRGGGAGFAYGSKLYVIGGVPDNGATTPPLNTVTTGIHDDNMNMVPLFGSTATPEYFIGGTGSSVVDRVYGLGTGVIPALPRADAPNQNAAWGYAVGGFGADHKPTAKIFGGPIGGPQETNATKRAPDGWFYSQFHDIQLAGDNNALTEARVLSVRWFSEVDRSANPGADIALEFRRTTNLPCNEAAFAGSEWVRLDANTASQTLYSRDGSVINQVKLSDVFPTTSFTARCFQYRVYITQNGSTAGVPNTPGNSTVTPKLYKVDVETTKPGDPDLKIETFDMGVDARGRFATYNLQIKNLNGTIGNTVEAPEGEFPVVMCIAYSAPGQAMPTLNVPTLPITGDADNRVDCPSIYHWVNWTNTNPNQQPFTISSSEWYANHTDSAFGWTQDQELNARNVFNREGNYAVAVLIDPFNVVPEAGAGKTDNRGENLNNGQPLIRQFTVSDVSYTSYMPVVVR